jgi:hypothetical protein
VIVVLARIRRRFVIRPAMRVDPANARVAAHMGRRLADQALKQGSDPDDAERSRRNRLSNGYANSRTLATVSTLNSGGCTY